MEISTLVGTPSLRLSAPIQYFEELEELEQAVFEQSGADCYAAAVAGPQPDYIASLQARHAYDDTATVKDQLEDLRVVDHTGYIDQPEDESVTEDSCRVPILPCSPPGLQKSTEKLENLCLKLSHGSFEERVIQRKLFHLLECRNVAQRILWNICRLQRAGYISDRISLITMDQSRDNVAFLKSISMRQIKALIEIFTISANAASENETVDYQRLTLISQVFLTSVGLFRGFEAQERESIDKIVGRDIGPFIWRCAIHTLDFAVLLYTGAHTESIGERDFKSPISYFHVPGSYINITSNYLVSANCASMVYRRRLQCLDGLLNGVGVWVFHQSSSKSPDPNLDTHPLHLATDSKTLADIWGPMWEEKIEGGPPMSPHILRYKIGNGSIVPWSPSDVVELSDGEVYCHWISDEIDSEIASIRPLEGSETLVIGAMPDFEIDESCPLKSRLGVVIDKLRLADRVTFYSTAEDAWLPDTRSQAVQGGIAHFGILNGTITMSYKRRTQPWKKAVLEAWDPANDSGEPLALELYMGLEISLCTGNAIRVSVSSVLLSESMRRFFDPPTTNDFMEALEPRRHELNIIPSLWGDHPEWRKDISKSVYKCLKVLEGTGLMDEGRGPRFHAFWDPGSLIPASKVNFRKCGWMDILSENDRYGCLAVVVTKCLKSDHKDLRRCQAHLGPNDEPEGKSALRTSFKLNEPEPPLGLMNMGTGQWFCTIACKGKLFRLSGQGIWQVVAVLYDQTGNHGLLMRSEQGLLIKGKRFLPLSNRKSVKVIESGGTDPSNPLLPVLLY